MDEDRPHGGVRDQEAECWVAEPEPEDREGNERDGRDRPQELDYDRRRVLDRPGASDRDPERHADADGEREALDIGLERGRDLARERPVRHPIDECACRMRWCSDAVGEIEHPNCRFGEHEHGHGEEPTGDIRASQEAVFAQHSG